MAKQVYQVDRLKEIKFDTIDPSRVVMSGNIKSGQIFVNGVEMVVLFSASDIRRLRLFFIIFFGSLISDRNQRGFKTPSIYFNQQDNLYYFLIPEKKFEKYLSKLRLALMNAKEYTSHDTVLYDLFTMYQSLTTIWTNHYKLDEVFGEGLRQMTVAKLSSFYLTTPTNIKFIRKSKYKAG